MQKLFSGMQKLFTGMQKLFSGMRFPGTLIELQITFEIKFGNWEL
jgi:hypothetical protein